MNFNEIFAKNVIFDDIKSDSLQTVYFFKYILRINIGLLG